MKGNFVVWQKMAKIGQGMARGITMVWQMVFFQQKNLFLADTRFS
jgi:hypothetical protein